MPVTDGGTRQVTTRAEAKKNRESVLEQEVSRGSVGDMVKVLPMSAAKGPGQQGPKTAVIQEPQP